MPNDTQYRCAALRIYRSNEGLEGAGDIQVADTDTAPELVHRVRGGTGAWVKAWVWVPDVEADQEPQE
jgi:hypothetical protein